MKITAQKKIVLIAFKLSFCLFAFSQNGNPLQYLHNVSQSSYINPAYTNQNDQWVIGLPIVSGAYFSWDANFSMEYFLSERNTFDYEQFYESLDETGKAFSTLHIPLIYISLGKHNKTYSFSITEKMINSAYCDNEILNFASQGLIPYYNNNQTFSPLLLRVQYYREMALGYSVKPQKGFCIGFRPKILFGKFYYGLENTSISVSTNTGSGQLLVTPEGRKTISGPLQVHTDEEEGYITLKPDMTPDDYFFEFKNMGFGIDMGVTLSFGKQSEFSFSVLDLGFTSLKHETHTVEFVESLYFDEDELYQSSNPNAPRYLPPNIAVEYLNNSLPYLVDEVDEDKRMIHPLPLQLNAQYKQALNTKLYLGLSDHFTYYEKHTTNYLSGFLYASLGEKFELSSALSLYNSEKLMLGLGASYTGKTSQFYISTNNISDLLRPYSAKNINLWFGINLLFPSV